ncbi:MAG: sigma 54-interacting transcriptional regulator [Sandaracinaceae bacterium]
MPVLVTGETGVGKEVIAQAIHKRGPRADGPMLVVNCAAMPDAHVASVLFGHEAGAFEGATEARDGLLAKAQGGTLFLDEVASLGEEAQGALLRALETQVIRRIGGDEDIPIDARLVAATHADPARLAETGAMRQDLLFRLDGIRIRVPALRERPGDLDPLIDRFLEGASVGGGARVLGIDDAARAALHAYPWPGNVRELKNAIERAVVACTAERIAIGDLPPEVRPKEAAPEAEAGVIDLRAELAAHEQRLLREALTRAHGDGKRAAKLLSIPHRTLVRKLDEHGLSDQLA